MTVFNHETASYEREEGSIKVQNFNSHNTRFAYSCIGKEDDPALPVVIWAHGWGHSHKSFKHYLAALEQQARHIALDFPGFGESPEPPEHWGTIEYADAIASWIKDNNMPPVLWIGHSFGCRVGTQLAAHHPECVREMIYIAGAGLKRPRPFYKRLYLFIRIRLFKALRHYVPESSLKKKLVAIFGSSDYNQTSGIMRKILVRIVNEDLVEEAKKISCPVTLIYGTEDTETPPSIGKKYAQLIKNSQLHLLEGQDHISVLQNGRHRIIKIISDTINDL
ncbi:MAG: alpha/beta hydrolase [Alphaproteobacteria bacterium]|nr:alpha/beta hydrolase [Alphaproteobacteria bacterium]